MTPWGKDWKREKHNHAEAFCVMQYRCEKCGTTDFIWNSRDGVTPFMVGCRKCEGTMQHTEWEHDRCDPGYTPRPGQRMFIDLSWEKATEIAKQIIDQWKNCGYEWVEKEWFDHTLPENQGKLKEETEKYYMGGQSPDIIEYWPEIRRA
jgi:hypothetical protein